MPYICQADLLKRRNWTMRRIREFLGCPDKTEPNPQNKSYRDMKLYDTRRVINAETSQQFLFDVLKYSKRRSEREPDDDLD